MSWKSFKSGYEGVYGTEGGGFWSKTGRFAKTGGLPMKGNKKDWFHFLHPLEKIDEMPEESKPREAPVLDDDQKRMNFEKEEQKRRAKVGRVSTMLSENSTLG